VAFTVTTLDAEKDESETALWMVATDGGEPWRHSAEQPRWSSDGRRFAFLAERKVDEDEGEEPKAQVWAFDLRGGDAQRLTEVPQASPPSSSRPTAAACC
jgi:dipeptidyl aminopeptidase/acylaminoacyl peptidase